MSAASRCAPCERASSIPSSSFVSGRITLRLGEVGEARETLAADYDGPDVQIGFNAQYLSDFLNVAGEGQVAFEFKDGQSQAQMRPATGDEYDYKYVIMPMRL